MIKPQIESDLIAALKSHDQVKVGVLRLLKNALSNAEINQQTTLDAESEIQVLKKQAKDRQEAISLYQKSGKTEAAEKEQTELDIIQSYLPEEMSDDALEPLVNEAISTLQPSGMSDFGKVMGYLMPKLKGQVDGSRLSAMIKQKLS